MQSRHSVNDQAVRRPLRAMIVGGAGITGRSFADELRHRGARLLIVDFDQIGVSRLRQDCDDLVIVGDALDHESVENMFAMADDKLGGLDLLVNVAGSGYVRTLAMMRTSKAFSERQRDEPGFIVNVGSPSRDASGPITYAGSEIAFDRLSESLSRRAKNPHIRIVTLQRMADSSAIKDLVDQLCSQWADLG